MISVSLIAAALKKELGSYFSTEAHRDNDIVRYINSATRAITISRNFDFNQYDTDIVVTEWTTKYNIPYQIETFFVKKDNEDIEYENFVGYHGLSNKSWILWIYWDKAICESPWTYKIFYRWFPPHIFSLEDSLDIPEHFYDLVLLKATYFWFADIAAYDKANNKDTIFDGMIKDMATRSSNPRPLVTKRLNKSKRKQW